MTFSIQENMRALWQHPVSYSLEKIKNTLCRIHLFWKYPHTVEETPFRIPQMQIVRQPISVRTRSHPLPTPLPDPTAFEKKCSHLFYQIVLKWIRDSYEKDIFKMSYELAMQLAFSKDSTIWNHICDTQKDFTSPVILRLFSQSLFELYQQPEIFQEKIAPLFSHTLYWNQVTDAEEAIKGLTNKECAQVFRQIAEVLRENFENTPIYRQEALECIGRDVQQIHQISPYPTNPLRSDLTKLFLHHTGLLLGRRIEAMAKKIDITQLFFSVLSIANDHVEAVLESKSAGNHLTTFDEIFVKTRAAHSTFCPIKNGSQTDIEEQEALYWTQLENHYAFQIRKIVQLIFEKQWTHQIATIFSTQHREIESILEASPLLHSLFQVYLEDYKTYDKNIEHLIQSCLAPASQNSIAATPLRVVTQTFFVAFVHGLGRQNIFSQLNTFYEHAAKKFFIESFILQLFSQQAQNEDLSSDLHLWYGKHPDHNNAYTRLFTCVQQQIPSVTQHLSQTMRIDAPLIKAGFDLFLARVQRHMEAHQISQTCQYPQFTQCLETLYTPPESSQEFAHGKRFQVFSSILLGFSPLNYSYLKEHPRILNTIGRQIYLAFEPFLTSKEPHVYFVNRLEQTFQELPAVPSTLFHTEEEAMDRVDPKQIIKTISTQVAAFIEDLLALESKKSYMVTGIQYVKWVAEKWMLPNHDSSLFSPIIEQILLQLFTDEKLNYNIGIQILDQIVSDMEKTHERI